MCPDCRTAHLGGPCGFTNPVDRMRTVAVDYHPTASVDRRGLGHSTRRLGRGAERHWNQRLDRFAGVVAQGMEPETISHAAMDKAERLSEQSGEAFRAGKYQHLSDPQAIVETKMAELVKGNPDG
jgi:hypothetical protein